MSLKASGLTTIPEDTTRIAKADLKGNRYILLRDTFGELFTSEDFRHLFHTEGRPTYDPARLALVTLLQFAENLSDEAAANPASISSTCWFCLWRTLVSMQACSASSGRGWSRTALSDSSSRCWSRASRHKGCCVSVASNAPIRRMCWLQ